MKNEEMLINGNITILDAMKQLDITAKKVLFIVDQEKKLCASVTDGDVRRWILANGNLDAPIKSAANCQPQYLMEESVDLVFSYMKKKKIDAVPILDENHKIIQIITADDQETDPSSEELEDVPVVIMAGGGGDKIVSLYKDFAQTLDSNWRYSNR